MSAQPIRVNASLGGGLARLPLVSLAVVNWNYDAYVGQAIDSLQAQDYPEIEIIIVDSGSSDDSLEVIDAHVAGDPRCRVISLPENLGHLGAFLHVLPTMSGQFIVSVDADDVLRPDFVSTHVQVHLALATNVALTSSNLVEIDQHGQALTGHHQGFNQGVRPSGMGLGRMETALRVPSISDAAYLEMGRSVFVYQPSGGWFWSPGTSNMYRRSLIELARPSHRSGPWMRGVDSLFNPLCHLLGGSALIDLPLSAYRLHGANSFSDRATNVGLLNGNAQGLAKMVREGSENLGIILAKASVLRPILGDRFWPVLDALCADVQQHPGSTPFVLAPLRDHYQSLCRSLGAEPVHSYLGARLTHEDYGFVVGESGASLAGRPHPPETLRPAAAAEEVYEDRLGVGPGSLLSADPPIFLSGLAFKEFVGIARAFGEKYGDRPAAFILYPTWTIAGATRSAAVVTAARAHGDRYPSHRLVFMCNTAEERDLLQQGGLTALLLNKNFMVSERTFRPLPEVTVEFDALYNARFDPQKRHYLAADINDVAYLSYYDNTCTPALRLQQQLTLATTLARNPTHKLLNQLDDGVPIGLLPDEVNAELNRAAVGLCLSAEEGANYASMEYLLAGLPVVSTPSIGGREVYFDHEFCTVCDPHPAAVRLAVESLRSRKIPPEMIRQQTLAKIEPPRRRFLALIDNLSEQLGGRAIFGDATWPFHTREELIRWDEYSNHLLEFENRAGAQSTGNSGGRTGGRVQHGLDVVGHQLEAGPSGLHG